MIRIVGSSFLESFPISWGIQKKWRVTQEPQGRSSVTRIRDYGTGWSGPPPPVPFGTPPPPPKPHTRGLGGGGKGSSTCSRAPTTNPTAAAGTGTVRSLTVTLRLPSMTWGGGGHPPTRRGGGGTWRGERGRGPTYFLELPTPGGRGLAGPTGHRVTNLKRRKTVARV